MADASRVPANSHFLSVTFVGLNMNKYRSHALRLYLSALLGFAAVPSCADDIEIYTGINNLNATVNPNVLFIIDTSGSMGIRELIVSDPYNPNTNYSGSCSSSRIYWSTNGKPPPCSSNNYFEKSKFRCDAADSALFSSSGGTGFYQDRLAIFYSSRFFWRPQWGPLSDLIRSPPHVECQADEGVHGENNGSSAKFIIDNSQAYTSNANSKRNWSRTGRFYTLFSDNYVNWFNSPGDVVSARRIDIVKDAVKALIDSNTGLNVGLMRFARSGRGGPIIFPFTDIDGSGVKADFKNAVSSLSASGTTPLAETMSEALRIFRGNAAFFGKSPQNSSNNFSVSSAFNNNNRGGTYNSPLDVQCQKNFIVYLTDGEPFFDSKADSFINGQIAGAAVPSGDTSCSHNRRDNCLDELAEFMNETDLIPGLDGDQHVVTYTIGFGSGAGGTLLDLLKQTSTKGGGEAFVASDFLELSNAFTQIVTEIQAVNTTFTAPAVSVNAFNRITNREELFFTLFKPSETPFWTGNLKRYRIGNQLDGAGNPVDSDGDGVADLPIILDANGSPATSDQTGFFDISSTSFWTTAEDAPDGDESIKGGTARLLGGGTADPASARKVYTNFVPTQSLAAATNAVNKDNAALTEALLGLTAASTDPNRVDLLNWLSGIDIKDEDGDGSSADARRVMGDPLHTKPVLLEYAASSSAASDITIYMTTNEGVLHAFNSDTGVEEFSFIPQQHLARSLDYFSNTSVGAKDYGIDGPLTVFFRDNNGNGFLDTGVDIVTGKRDQYILIFGERRGGNRYYAVDVTNRAQPRFLWNIVGGAGDFHELGQTWSAPRATKIKLNGQDREVLVFGGGYDTLQDQVDQPRTGDTKGRALYIVDTLTGALIWWAAQAGLVGDPASPVSVSPFTNVCAVGSNGAKNCVSNKLRFSIPADVRVIDLDGDGFMDRIYAADMGGQILRIDIENEASNSAAELVVDGYIVADLQRASSSPTAPAPAAADNRRFFFAPDVALFSKNVDAPFLSIAIGSGYRAHPLNNTVRDRFFMVMDKAPFAKPAAYDTTHTVANLKDITTELTSPDLSSFDGWYINLVDASGTFAGQKVLSESITFGGNILFTTFTPVAGVSAGSCAPNQGIGQVFAVSAIDGTPTTLATTLGGGSGGPNGTPSSRLVKTLKRTGIPPEVTLLFPPGVTAGNGNAIGSVGPEALGLDLPTTPVKTYWFELETQ